MLRDGDVVWIGTTTLLARGTGEALPEVTPVEPPTPSSQAGFLSRVANGAIHKPKLVLGLLVLFTVFAAMFGGPVAGILRDNRGFDDPSSENVVVERVIAQGHELVAGAREPSRSTPPRAASRRRPSGESATCRAWPGKLARGRGSEAGRHLLLDRRPALVSRDRTSTVLAIFYRSSPAPARGTGQGDQGAFADPPKIEFGVRRS